MGDQTQANQKAAPKYMTICDKIVESIECGELKPGDDLPSIRVFAREKNISPATVDRAYAWLEANGYIETIHGKGSRVSFIGGNALPASTGWQVFWSYARKDDELSHGAITRLCHAIQDEYQLQTGEELRVFLDKDSLEWGDNWSEEIRNNLGDTVFFIPVLTPTYLRRPSCIQELKTVYHVFREANLERGIYPIHFVSVRNALDNMFDDELANFLKSTQAELSDNPFRFRDENSIEYQQCVYRIVEALIERNEELIDAQNALLSQSSRRSAEVEQDEDLGIIDQLSNMETSCQSVINIVCAMEKTIAAIGDAVSGEKFDEADSFSKRLVLFKRVARRLDDPAEQLKKQCTEYNAQLTKMGAGIDAFIRLEEIVEYDERKAYSEAVAEFYNSIDTLNEQTNVAFQQVRMLIGAIKKAELLSRELKPSCRAIRAALEDFCGSERLFQQWRDRLARQIDNEVTDALGE